MSHAEELTASRTVHSYVLAHATRFELLVKVTENLFAVFAPVRGVCLFDSGVLVAGILGHL
jgi:hypothetical protein